LYFFGNPPQDDPADPPKKLSREGHPVFRGRSTPGLLGYFRPVTPPDGRGMSLSKYLSILLGLFAAAVLAIGCGETVIDATKTEEALEANLSKSLKEKVASVECPSDQKVEKGATFTCSVKLQKGEEQTATLKILNENADVSVTNLRGSNE
jgi:hypothetical protein